MEKYQGDAPSKAKRAKLKVTRNIKKRHQESANAAPTDIIDEDNQSLENSQKQLVVFNPATSDVGQEASPEPASAEWRPSPISYFPSFTAPNSSSRVLPSVGAFAVQCATCFKWRLVPTKEKYEEIRESILEDPFVCEKAREWRSDISCDDPADISQDGSRLWAIDKPSIAQPPPGWERILRIRGEGSTKFADVYYAAPSGKRLRSMVEVQKYLLEHPEYATEGLKLSQFSFQIPRPLQENYVRKRTVPIGNPYEMTSSGLSRPLEPAEVNPLSRVGPEANTNLEIGRAGSPIPLLESSVPNVSWRSSPAKKKRKSSPKQMYKSSTCDSPAVKVEDVREAGTYSHQV